MKKYTLEYLNEEFEKHIKAVQKASYYKKGDFLLSKALKTIVDELIRIRDGIPPDHS